MGVSSVQTIRIILRILKEVVLVQSGIVLVNCYQVCLTESNICIMLNLKCVPLSIPLSLQKWGRSLTPVRIPSTRKTSKVEVEVDRAGLITSTHLSLAAASTSSSTTIREEDLTNTKGRGWGTFGKNNGVFTEKSSSELVLQLGHSFVSYLNLLILNAAEDWAVRWKKTWTSDHWIWGSNCCWINFLLWLKKMKSCQHLRSLEMERWWLKAVTVGVRSYFSYFFVPFFEPFYQGTLF